MGGQLINDAARKNVYLIEPERALIAGVDFGEEDPIYESFYDVRVKLPLDEGTKESIKAFGVREPCEVVVLDDERIIVADGRRRNLHLRAVNKTLPKAERKLLPVIGIRGTADAVKVAGLIGEHLNNHRVQDSVMTKATKAVRMMDIRGYSKEQVALALGVSELTVDEYRKLLGLAKPVRAAIDDGQISPSAAAKLAGLPQEAQVEELEKLVIGSGGKKVTVKNANAAAKGAKNGTEVVAAPSKRALRRAIENGAGILSKDLILGIRIAIGDLPPNNVKGLVSLLRGDDGSAE